MSAVVKAKATRLYKYCFVWMTALLLTKSSVAWSTASRRNLAVAHQFWNRINKSGRHPFFHTTTTSSMSAKEDENPRDKKKSKTVHSLLSGKKIVSVEECLHVFGEPGLVFVDGSWFLKDRNGREEFEAGPRIPGARFFDIDDISAKGDVLNPKGLPHMMPPKELFAAAMDAMDISNYDHLIVYANKGCMFVHRALFQIQAMGHERDRVHLMDGSLEEWENNGGKLDKEPTKAILAEELDLTKPTSYKGTDPQNVVDMEEVKSIIAKGQEEADAIIVDVRSAERFAGSVEEPRPGLRLGHMPGAKNLFFATLLDPDNVAKLKSAEELQEIISEAGIDLNTNKRIVASCGSGATACTLAAALDICGRDSANTFIYDGSWSEWGSSKDAPITKDPEE